MKRLPLLLTFTLFIALCMSMAYWGLRFFKPAQRPVIAPSQPVRQEVTLSAAGGLFGGRAVVAVASNYQLRGVVESNNPVDSVAIISADGKPAQAVRVGAEISSGTTVKEVQRQYVLLSEGGVIKRVDLPDIAKNTTAGDSMMGASAPASGQMQQVQSMMPPNLQQPQIQQMPSQMPQPSMQLLPPPVQQMPPQFDAQQAPPQNAVPEEFPQPGFNPAGEAPEMAPPPGTGAPPGIPPPQMQ